MRTLVLVLSVGAVSACAQPEPISVAHKSELKEQVRGIALAKGGHNAVVGIWATTCELETSDANMTYDFNMPTNDEKVVDIGENDRFGSVLVGTSEDGVHVILLEEEHFGAMMHLPIEKVVNAKAHPEGVAVLWNDPVEGCSAGWFRSSVDGQAVVLGSGFCGADGDMDVDSQTGRLWIGGADRLATVYGDGTFDVMDGGELLALDEGLGVLYTARRNEPFVHGLSMQGDVLWVADVGGPVTALDDMGTVGAAAVMVGREGTGELVFLDGLTGGVLSEASTPSAASQIAVSDNGRTLALTLSGGVHFFEVTAAP